MKAKEAHSENRASAMALPRDTGREHAAEGQVNPHAVARSWRVAMHRAGRNVSDVSHTCGVGTAAVVSWISGRRTPSVQCLLKAAYLLRTTPADLLGWLGCSHPDEGAQRVNLDWLREAWEKNAARCMYGLDDEAAYFYLIADIVQCSQVFHHSPVQERERLLCAMATIAGRLATLAEGTEGMQRFAVEGEDE